jgi:hypothetical protein
VAPARDEQRAWLEDSNASGKPLTRSRDGLLRCLEWNVRSLEPLTMGNEVVAGSFESVTGSMDPLIG